MFQPGCFSAPLHNFCISPKLSTGFEVAGRSRDCDTNYTHIIREDSRPIRTRLGLAPQVQRVAAFALGASGTNASVEPCCRLRLIHIQCDLLDTPRFRPQLPPFAPAPHAPTWKEYRHIRLHGQHWAKCVGSYRQFGGGTLRASPFRTQQPRFAPRTGRSLLPAMGDSHRSKESRAIQPVGLAPRCRGAGGSGRNCPGGR